MMLRMIKCLEPIPNVHACAIECSRHSSLHAVSPVGTVPWMLNKRTAVAHLWYEARGEHASSVTCCASLLQATTYRETHATCALTPNSNQRTFEPAIFCGQRARINQTDALLVFPFQLESHFDRVIAHPCHAYFLPSSSWACLPPLRWPSSPRFLSLIAARCLLLTRDLGFRGVSPLKASTSCCSSASSSNLT